MAFIAFKVNWNEVPLEFVEEGMDPEEASPANELPTEAIVYPNPFRDQLHLRLPSGFDEGALRVYNEKGQMVLFGEISGNEMSIQLDEIPAGLYFLKAASRDGRSFDRKIVKVN